MDTMRELCRMEYSLAVQRHELLTQAITQMSPEITVLSGRRQTQKTYTRWCHLCEILQKAGLRSQKTDQGLPGREGDEHVPCQDCGRGDKLCMPLSSSQGSQRERGSGGSVLSRKLGCLYSLKELDWNQPRNTQTFPGISSCGDSSQ